MKRNLWLIITLSLIISCALNAGQGWTAEKGPIKEPVYESPRVYTNIDGKVVFKEFIEGLIVTRIEFFDPDSGELLYGASLMNGRLVGKREGSAVGENDGPFNESESIIKHKYLTQSKNIVLMTRESKGEIGEYSVIGGNISSPLTIGVRINKGRIERARWRFLLNNEKVDFKRNYGPNLYEETYFHDDGSDTYYRYKLGLLQTKRHLIPAPGGGSFPSYQAEYLQGRLSYFLKYKNNQNFITETSVYDAQDKFIGNANPIFGEKIFIRRIEVNGQKALQVIHRGKDGKEKIKAKKFED